MKTMTCKQLGGACDYEIQANTFEEMAEISKAHGMKMAEQNDEAHLQVMEEMKKGMKDPVAMKEWMDEKRREFDSLPENE